MRYLYFLLCLRCSSSLQAQTSDTLQNYCSQRCGTTETCLCQCFFERGQALRKAEQYGEAIKQFRVSARLCDDKRAQTIIDSILYHEQRTWLYEGGTNGKFAIANGLGELVDKGQGNPYRFSNPEPFRKGVAICTNELGKYLFVNADGKIQTPLPGYDWIIPTEGDLFYLIEGTKSSITTEAGFTPIYWASRYQYHKDRPHFLSELGPWGTKDSMRLFFNRSLKYKEIGDPHEKLVRVKKGGKLGLIDQSGHEIIAPKYERIGEFMEGFASIEKGGKQGFIDISGQEIIPPKYEYIRPFEEGISCVNMGGKAGDFGLVKGGKWGFIDKNGQEIIPPQYEDAESFYNGLAQIKKGGKWGLIDLNNREVLTPKYEDMRWCGFGGQ